MNIHETAEKDDNIVDIRPELRVITGGRGGGFYPDYLTSMDCGTRFLTRPRGYRGSDLIEWQHGGRRGKAVLLFTEVDNTEIMRWHSIQAFCDLHELIEKFELPKLPDKEAGEDNGSILFGPDYGPYD